MKSFKKLIEKKGRDNLNYQKYLGAAVYSGKSQKLRLLCTMFAANVFFKGPLLLFLAACGERCYGFFFAEKKDRRCLLRCI